MCGLTFLKSVLFAEFSNLTLEVFDFLFGIIETFGGVFNLRALGGFAEEPVEESVRGIQTVGGLGISVVSDSSDGFEGGHNLPFEKDFDGIAAGVLALFDESLAEPGLTDDLTDPLIAVVCAFGDFFVCQSLGLEIDNQSMLRPFVEDLEVGRFVIEERTGMFVVASRFGVFRQSTALIQLSVLSLGWQGSDRETEFFGQLGD